MIIIEPGILIANYFGENPDKKSLSYAKLAEIKRHIEVSFHEKGKHLVCDLSEESIQNVMRNYPQYFERKGSNIFFLCETESEMNDFYEELFGIFNASFDEEAQKIKHDLLTVIEEIVTK